MLCDLVDATSAAAPTAWRRRVHLTPDAYRARRAHAIPEAPMTDEQLYDAMVHLGKVKESPINGWSVVRVRGRR